MKYLVVELVLETLPASVIWCACYSSMIGALAKRSVISLIESHMLSAAINFARYLLHEWQTCLFSPRTRPTIQSVACNPHNFI